MDYATSFIQFLSPKISFEKDLSFQKCCLKTRKKADKKYVFLKKMMNRKPHTTPIRLLPNATTSILHQSIYQSNNHPTNISNIQHVVDLLVL